MLRGVSECECRRAPLQERPLAEGHPQGAYDGIPRPDMAPVRQADYVHDGTNWVLLGIVNFKYLRSILP